MKANPTHVIWNNPPAYSEVKYSETLSNRLIKKLDKNYSSPLFHYWIYEEILDGLNKRIKNLQGFSGEIFAVDVCIDSNISNYIAVNYSTGALRTEPSILLGKWITEKIMSLWTAKKQTVLNLPDVIVRCFFSETDSFESDERARGENIISRKMKSYFSRLLKIDDFGEKPFNLYFQDYFIHYSAEIEVKDLTGNKNVESFVLQPNKTNYLPGGGRIGGNYILTSKKHATISLVVFPADNAKLIYIKHGQTHETWINSGKENNLPWQLESWNMIPKDGWAPVVTKNIIVLGRIVNSAIGAKIVPGSMVLQIKYPQNRKSNKENDA